MIGLRDVAVINPQTYNKVVCERRFMLSAVLANVVGMILFIVAISVAEWVVVDFDVSSVPGLKIAADMKNESTVFYKKGIWGEWEVTTKQDGDSVGKFLVL